MLTDDPGTVETHHWEINTSFDTEISSFNQFAIPLIDANYGYNVRTQFKMEIPNLLSETEAKVFVRKFENPTLGIKFRFIDEENAGIAISTYPAVTFSFRKGQTNEYKLPFEFQKTIGKILIGEEIGVLFTDTNSQTVFNGTLLGIQPSERLEVMAEWYFSKNLNGNKATAEFLNGGMRYKISTKISMLVSAGTQIVTSPGESRERFFSFLGFQLRI